MKKIIFFSLFITIIYLGAGCKVPFKGSGEDVYNDTYLYDQYGRESLAIKHWKKAVSAEPDSVNAHFSLANSYMRVGKYKLAEEEYKKVLELDPKHVYAAIKLGNIDFYKGNYNVALKKWKDAPLLDPKQLDSLEKEQKGNVGLLYAKTRDHDLTSDRWKKALNLADYQGKELNSWGYLGLTYYNQKQYKKAITEWEKVIKIAPDSFAATQARENIKLAQAELDKESVK